MLSAGMFLLLYNALNRTALVPQEADMADFAWLIFAFVFLRLLLSRKFSLQRDEANLVQLSDSNLNSIIGYRFLSTATTVFIPLLLALYIGVIQRSPVDAMAAFVSLFLFINVLNGAAFFLQIRKLSMRRGVCRAVNAALLVGVCAILFLQISGSIYIGSALRFFIYPMLAVVNALGYDAPLTFSAAAPSLIFYALLYAFLFVAFYKWLSSREYRMSLESEVQTKSDADYNNRIDESHDRAEEDKRKTELSRRIRFTLPGDRRMIVRMTFSTGGQFMPLILPSLIYIIISIYSFHVAFTGADEMNSAGFVMAQWFALLGFPVIYIAPNFKMDIKYLWIYRCSARSKRIFFISNLLKYFFRGVLSLTIASAVIYLYLLVVYGANFFEFVDTSAWLFLTFAMPVLFSLIGLFVTLKLPDAYFNSNNNISIVPMIAMIWLFALVTLPIILGVMAGHAYTTALLFLISSIILFLICKRVISKIEI